MKIAIPIWNGRVSPVMDTARQLLIAEIDDGLEVSRTVVDIPQTNISHLANFISGHRIDTLICGAISHQLEQMLAASGIRINPWFRGNVDKVIAAHSAGILQDDNFLLPGCGRGRRRGRGGRRGRHAKLGWRKRFKEE
ncbi:MAG: dinitrogenase iron-molybdenum cofactor biosynthesis protein [candidate division Zixibacteria bacterium]|nr:dinitrogenase iron-molybdenum cofactor biosynthesis protein [candidate division Zixibacteria bacterium]